MALTNDQPSAKKILCDNCDSEDAAQSRCNECGIFLCQFCTESHKRSRSTKHHKLLTMEELKSNPGPQKIAEKMRCPRHKLEVIKLFCKTCQTTICRDCTIVDHQGHKYGFVEEVAVEEKQHLQRNLNEVKHRKFRVVKGIANLKRFNKVLEAKKKSTISEINRHFDEIVKAVESRKREMVGKATALTNSKQKQIHTQLEVLEVALASCESSIEFTEQAFKNGNDVQILSMEKYILQSLEQLKAVKDQTKPCVTEEMVFIIPSSVQETKEKLLNAYDVDVPVVSPGNCNASFNDTEPFLRVGIQLYTLTLICNDKNDQRLRYGGHDIKPSFSVFLVDLVSVADNKDGSYTISFRPLQVGMLEFEVSINGMPAPSCSLTKQVKWAMSHAYGKGVITDGGLTMKGESGYCCRVGYCTFESGVHTWKVRLSYRQSSHSNHYHTCIGEIGIIDCDEITGDITKSQKKWVISRSVHSGSVDFSITLDMDKKSVVFTQNSRGYARSTVSNQRFTARRVLPFFASDSPSLSLTVLE